jgi:anti-anti-sigma regulatory factor
MLVSLLLLDPESNMLKLEVGIPYSQETLDRRHIPADEGITGWVVQHGEPVIVPDMSLDPRCIFFDEMEFDSRSELCVPLIAGSQVIGALNLESSRLNAFTDDDLQLLSTLASNLAVLVERTRLFDNMEQMVADRTQKLQESLEERERLQQEIIEAQKRAIQELSTPIIPVMDRIIVMPLIGSIDSLRARDIMRTLLAGIRKHRAKVVILDITGVPIVDSGVANHLNKTIQAARLKGARTIVTGISDAVAETIVDLGIDWSEIETLADLRTGLIVALNSQGIKLTRRKSKEGRE